MKRVLARIVPAVRHPAFLPCVVLTACWMLQHGYVGITHDARLYTAQALSRLYPGQFEGDLFLMRGSQEEFTLFSRLWAPLIDVAGAGPAAMLLVGVAHCLWVWGAFRLFRELITEPGARYLALAGAFVLPSWYGGLQVFSYGEGFLTPRIFAEALFLHALAWLLRGRVVAALIVIAASTALHPLCALAGAAVVGTWLCWQDRRWILAGAAACLSVAGLAWLEVHPFSRLLTSFDPEWLSIAQVRCALVFPAMWRGMDWGRTFLHLVLVGAAALLLRGRARQLFCAALIAAVSLLTLSSIAAAWGNTLLTQLQTWRVLWVTTLFGNAAAGFLIATLWRESPNRVPLVSLIASACCWVWVPQVAVPLTIAFASAMFMDWRYRGRPWPRMLLLATCGVTGLTAAFCGYAELDLSATLGSLRIGTERETTSLLRWLSQSTWFLIGLLVYAIGQWKAKWSRSVASGLAIAALAVACIGWDRRSYWEQWMESAALSEVPLAKALPHDAVVWWYDSAPESWLLLRRPSYFSNLQAAGLLLSRENALESMRRLKHLQDLENPDALQFGSHYKQMQKPTAARLASACMKSEQLHAIIASHRVPGIAAMSWRPPVPRTTLRSNEPGWFMETQTDFYLYRCSDLRTPLEPRIVLPISSRVF